MTKYFLGSPSFWLVLGAAVGTGCGSAAPTSPPQSASDAPLPPSPTPAPATVEEVPSLVADVELSNPSTFARTKSPLRFHYYDLGLAADDPMVPTLVLKVGDAVVPSEAIDDDGDGKKDALLALVDLAPAQTLTGTIVADRAARKKPLPKLTQAEISHKVGGEWKPRKDKPELEEYVGGKFQNVTRLTVPPEHTDHSNFIRYEGPGIESDRVAYRVYLDWRNGFDIFGKKVSTPVLQGVGQDGFESYHHAAPWGMDILKVGRSLGIGGFGYWAGDKVALVSDVKRWDASILANGNLYSSFRITYAGWKIAGKELDVSADFSMVGGSRLVRTRLALSSELPNLAIGIVKHPGVEELRSSSEVTGKAFSYLGTFGKQSLAEDRLGMAVLFQQGDKKSEQTDAANHAVVVEPAGKALEYYFLAAWEGEPGSPKNKADFAAELEREAEALTIPVRVRTTSVRSREAKTGKASAESALGWAKKLADSELARKTLGYRHDGWDVNRRRKPKFEYDIVGVLPLAYDTLAEVAPEPRYAEVVEKVTGSYVGDQGEIREYTEDEYNLDAVNPGRALLRLHARTKAHKYKLAVDRLRTQLAKQPKTSEGAYFHKKKYPSQLWADGVYMAMPFLAAYSAAFEGGKSYREVVNEFVVARKHLRRPDTGLYLHAWDEKKQQPWADPKTGLSKEVWARGMGWFAMAVVDVLDVIPANEQKLRAPLLEIVTELGATLARVQDSKTGTWWQVMDKPTAPGNYRESTASAMFTYFFARAVAQGYLPPSYRDTAVRAFEGLVNEFITVHPDGKVSMTHQCLVAGLGFGRDGSYRYYMSEPVFENDPKGTGPFILAGVAVHRLLAGKPS
jgi:unsaturated rhamnogalacturonyl hydrolase